MAQIPSYFIQDLLNRTDIVDLIQVRVPIKKRGGNYLGICPFHQEKSPSFTVSQPKQFYHCFGCGKHGNAIGFLMDFDRLDFVDAVEELARQQGLEVPREQSLSAEKKEDFQILFDVMTRAAGFYEAQLKIHPHRKSAIDYLKKRGLSGVTAKRFGLGFAAGGWENLLQFLSPNPSEIKALKHAGLLSHNDSGKVFDKFRNRIMFPIRDKRGRVVAFGGRTLDQEEGPKYLNSPETPLFHKGKMLYGLYEAKRAQAKFQQILVVEGYMDVVMLAQHGISYAVGALGTATTADHIRLLKQESHEILFCFDGDDAGREAAWRALKVTLPFMTGELDIRFLFLPEGEDPDTLVQQEGKAAFEKRLRVEALPLADFIIKKLDEGINLHSLAGKSRWILDFKTLADSIPLGPYKTFLLDTIAKRFNFTFDQVTDLLDKGLAKSEPLAAPKAHLSLLEKGLALLLQHPFLAGQAFPLHDKEEENQILNHAINTVVRENLQSTGQVIEFFRNDPDETRFSALAIHPYPRDIQDLEAEWQDILKKLNDTSEKELDALQNLTKIRSLTPEENLRLLELLRQRR